MATPRRANESFALPLWNAASGSPDTDYAVALAAEVHTLFYLADTNEDGLIDFPEFKALILSGIDKRFHEFDVNKDGCLSAGVATTNAEIGSHFG